MLWALLVIEIIIKQSPPAIACSSTRLVDGIAWHPTLFMFFTLQLELQSLAKHPTGPSGKLEEIGSMQSVLPHFRSSRMIIYCTQWNQKLWETLFKKVIHIVPLYFVASTYLSKKLTWSWLLFQQTTKRRVAVMLTMLFEQILLQGSYFFNPVKFPDFSLTFPWFRKSFPWFFLSFHQDILVKKTYLFFLNVALVTLVYANIASLSAISWQLLRFNSLKKHFPQIFGFIRFENGLGKKFPDLKFFSLILAGNPCFSLISLTGKSLQNFPWIPWFPWSVGTLYYNIIIALQDI